MKPQKRKQTSQNVTGQEKSAPPPSPPRKRKELAYSWGRQVGRVQLDVSVGEENGSHPAGAHQRVAALASQLVNALGLKGRVQVAVSVRHGGRVSSYSPAGASFGDCRERKRRGKPLGPCVRVHWMDVGCQTRRKFN